MLRSRYVKWGMLTLALAILVVEGFFVYRWYDRYYGYDAAPGTATGSVVSEEDADETTRVSGQYAGSTNAVKDVEETTDETIGETTFTHTATESNSRGDYTYLSHPRLNGEPNAVVLATVSQDGEVTGESTTGEAYDHNLGVWYEFDDRNKWAIFNQDLAPVPAGTTFEVVIPPASESFVHRAEPANIEGSATYLDNPLTNGKPDATLSVTQNWNPGGGVGVYNDHPVEVFYDEDVEQWAVYNSDEAPMPDGAAFNVFVSGNSGSTR